MTIMLTALKEKIRKKELYIVSVIGVLFVLLFGTGSGSITVNGEAVTDFKLLMPILLIAVNAVCCILAAVMSLSTIPNEYERRTSHLVWVRKISQSRYHGELTMANVSAGMISEAILFCAVFIFMLINGRVGETWRLIPAYLIIAINVAAVSVLTSAVSVVIPRFAAGAIAITVTVMGVFHALLLTLKDLIGGFGGEMVKYALKIIPDLHAVQSQAANALCGKEVDIHTILTGLLAVYVYAVLIFILKRKEA